jgi:hypothetical protein
MKEIESLVEKVGQHWDSISRVLRALFVLVLSRCRCPPPAVERFLHFPNTFLPPCLHSQAPCHQAPSKRASQRPQHRMCPRSCSARRLASRPGSFSATSARRARARHRRRRRRRALEDGQGIGRVFFSGWNGFGVKL